MNLDSLNTHAAEEETPDPYNASDPFAPDPQGRPVSIERANPDPEVVALIRTIRPDLDRPPVEWVHWNGAAVTEAEARTLSRMRRVDLDAARHRFAAEGQAKMGEPQHEEPAMPLTHAQTGELRDQLAATLAAIEAGDLTATAATRHRIEGALAALSAVIGDLDQLATLEPNAHLPRETP